VTSSICQLYRSRYIQAMVPGSLRHGNKDRCKDAAFTQPQSAQLSFWTRPGRHTKLPERYPKTLLCTYSSCRCASLQEDASDSETQLIALQAEACENFVAPNCGNGSSRAPFCVSHSGDRLSFAVIDGYRGFPSNESVGFSLASSPVSLPIG
jgi:hypothetical protein